MIGAGLLPWLDLTGIAAVAGSACVRVRNGPWQHEMLVTMQTPHRGRLSYHLDHEDGGPILLSADVLLDHGLRIVHVYNPVYANFKAMCTGASLRDRDELRVGMRAVKRAYVCFPHRTSLHCMLWKFLMPAFVTAPEGSGDGSRVWQLGLGFDERHAENVHRRQHAVACRGGLPDLLPSCLVRHITDSAVTWAVPVLAPIPSPGPRPSLSRAPNFEMLCVHRLQIRAHFAGHGGN